MFRGRLSAEFSWKLERRSLKAWFWEKFFVLREDILNWLRDAAGDGGGAGTALFKERR
jgi:hypothetical protein